jgi:hypothetical protein
LQERASRRRLSFMGRVLLGLGMGIGDRGNQAGRAAPSGHDETRDRGVPWTKEKESRSQPPMEGGWSTLPLPIPVQRGGRGCGTTGVYGGVRSSDPSLLAVCEGQFRKWTPE